MSNVNVNEPGEFRFLRAVTIVLAVVLAAPGADAVVRFASGARQAAAIGAADAGINSASVLDAGDALTSLERIENLAASSQVVLPEDFDTEIGLLAGARDVRVSQEGSVVGYVVDEDCDTALSRLDELMGSRGWTRVTLGGADGSTYMKSSGSCIWALATTTQVGHGTSIVVRWERK